MSSEIDPHLFLLNYDPAWHREPVNRASFSNRPSFKIGAGQHHPIDSSEKSILARPDVAEALEAIYVAISSVRTNNQQQSSEPNQRNGDMNRPEESAPINQALAYAGLKWLRESKNIITTEYRARVTDTKKILPTIVEHQQERLRHKSDSLANSNTKDDKTSEVEHQNTSKIDKIKRQNEYRSKFRDELEKVLTNSPDLKGDHILELIEEVEIFLSDNIAAREKPKFHARIMGRFYTYLESPPELTNDLKLFIYLNYASDLEPGNKVIHTYSTIILTNIAKTFFTYNYHPDGLKPDNISQWLELISGNKFDEKPISDFRYQRTQAAAPELAEKVLFGTLSAALREKPLKFIRVVYDITRQGFDPDCTNPDKRKAAIYILSKFLADEELAPLVLYLSIQNKNRNLSEKAVDLYESLKFIFGNAYGHLISLEKIASLSDNLSSEKTKKIHKHFSDDLKKGGTTVRELSLKIDREIEEQIKNFKNRIEQDRSFRATTLYGHLLDRGDYLKNYYDINITPIILPFPKNDL